MYMCMYEIYVHIIKCLSNQLFVVTLWILDFTIICYHLTYSSITEIGFIQYICIIHTYVLSI